MVYWGLISWLNNDFLFLLGDNFLEHVGAVTGMALGYQAEKKVEIIKCRKWLNKFIYC